MPVTLATLGEDQAYTLQAYFVDDGSEYEVALRAGWDFIRRMGRYTPRTINALVDHADRAEALRLDGRRDDPDTSAWPTVFKVTMPFRYDEDTECKYGGVVGVAVVMPRGDDRVLLAVHRESRRKGIGRALLRHAPLYHYGSEPLVTWVSARNTDSQQFLLAQGWTPHQLNASGAVCYSLDRADAVEEVQEGLPTYTLTHEPRRRRRHTESF